MTREVQFRTIKELEDCGAITAIQDGNHGGDHPKASEYVPDGVPFVMASDIRNGQLRLDTAKRLPKARADQLRIGFARSGDVLLTHKGTVGEVAIVPDVPHYVMLTPQVTYYRVNENFISQRYLAFAFRSPQFQSELANISAQSTRPYIAISTQRYLRVPWCELVQQKRIASILGVYDDLIEVNRLRMAALEEMARRLFDEWFVHFRFPGHEGHKIVETPDGSLPEGWDITTLGELCETITDGAHHSPPSVIEGRLMASVKDMRDWDFDLSGCRQISSEHFDELVRNGCQPILGDIVIAKDGANLNKHTFLMWREMPLVLLSSVAIVRPPENFQREFLVALLKSDVINETIKQMKSGAAIPRIVLRDFKRLRIVLPPASLRQRFEDLAGPIHGMIRRLSVINGELAKSRDLLLPRLISGQLCVASAERELEAVA